MPLIRSLWVAKKSNRSVALQLVPNLKAKRVDFQVISKTRDGWLDQANPETSIVNPNFDGTVKRSSATCPCCGYTTPVARVREQLKARRGGTADARLICVISERPGQNGAQYRPPTSEDDHPLEMVKRRLGMLDSPNSDALSAVPNEPYPDETASGALSASVLYGFRTWGDLFAARQAVALASFSRLVKRVPTQIKDPDLAEAVVTCLAFCVSKLVDYLSSICAWRTARSCAAHTFVRQALPMTWDFAEMNPFAGSSGDWSEAVRYLGLFIEANLIPSAGHGTTEQSSATKHPLPDDIAQLLATDPPYYDAIAYGDLSDYFYVWLRRILREIHPSVFSTRLANKDDEIAQLSKRFSGPYGHKTKEFFESKMTQALLESRRVVQPGGIGVVVFAHKSTSGWEAMLGSLIDAGWTVTGSWTIDTERGARVNSLDTAALASSVHIVCRPREDAEGSVRTDQIGDWRDVLAELPRRIHEWMPRLAEEGVVGADAIFACLGPALEVFSRYSRVEKSSGDVVPLREYLEHVWAAVSHEALSMIFKDADAAGLEPDARLTAMWLWTLSAASSEGNGNNPEDEEEEASQEEEDAGKSSSIAGFVLEFDAARKIAQGLGIHLERSPSVVEVKGDKARLLPVAERTRYLFGKDSAEPTPAKKKPKKKDTQLSLFAALQEVDATESVEKPELKAPQLGFTVLDRVHQAMFLFAAGRGEALKRFLVEEGAGKDARFWKLAQSLSALYPSGIDEKRWVDGVLARKKSLGL